MNQGTRLSRVIDTAHGNTGPSYIPPAVYGIAPGGNTGPVYIPPAVYGRAPGAPSVSMAALNMFANKDKLKNEDYSDEGEDDDDGEDFGDGDDDEEGEENGEDVDGDDDQEEAVYDDRPDDGKYDSHGQDADIDAAVRTAQQDAGYGHFSGSREREPRDNGSMPRMSSVDTGLTPQMRLERIRLLAKLRRQQARLKPEERKRINPNSSLAQLRDLVMGSSYEVRAKQGVLLLRRLTVFIAKLVGKVSLSFPDLLPSLEGWSENVYLTLEQFEEMLYDIYDDYGDQLQGNSIVNFIVALGSSAAMFAMTKSIMDNPMTSNVLGGLMNAVQAQQDEQAVRRGSVRPGGATTTADGKVLTHPLTDEPAVRPHASDVVGHAGGRNPMMDDIGKALGGVDIGKLLGGLDLGAILGGAQQSAPSVQSSGAPVVNAIDGPSVDTDKVLSMLRSQEDATLDTIPEEAPPSEAPTRPKRIRYE